MHEVTLNGGGHNSTQGAQSGHEVTLEGGGDNSTETLKVTLCGHEVTFLYSIDVTSMMTNLALYSAKSSCVPTRGDFSVQ